MLFQLRHHGLRLTVSLAILLASSVALGQYVPLGDDVSRPIPGVGHNYVTGLTDTVSPANGSLHVKIDLSGPPGRGFTLPFALTYDSGEPFHATSLLPGEGYYGSPTGMNGDFATDYAQQAGGWGNTLPYVSVAGYNVPIDMAPYYGDNDWDCPMSGSYIFYDPSGESHMLALAAIGEGVQTYQNVPLPQQACAGLMRDGVGYAYESLGGDDQVYGQMDASCTGAYQGQGVIYPSDCDNAAPAFTVTDLTGKVYSFPANSVNTDASEPGQAVPPSLLYPSQVEDRNGNIVQFTYNGGSYGLPVTDTLGRTLVSQNAARNSYTVGGLTYTLQYSTTWSAAFSVGAEEIYPQGPLPANVTCSFIGQVSFSGQSILKSITLPNGQTYSFEYDSTYGLLDKITYPDGGWVQYVWGLPSTLSTFASFSGGDSDGSIETDALNGGCGYLYKPPVVLEREVGYSSNSGPAEIQTFTYSTSWDNGPNGYTGDWTSKTTTETDTDEVTGIVLKKLYTYGYVLQHYEPNTSGNVIPQLPVETKIQYYDGNGTLLETVNKTWADQFELTSETTTIPNVGTYGTAYCYNDECASQPAGNFPYGLTAKYEYGIGQVPSSMPPSSSSPGAPIRTTTYGYYGLTLPCHFTAPITYQTDPVPCSTALSTSNPSNGVTSTVVPLLNQVVTYSGAATYGSNGWTGTTIASTTAYDDGTTGTSGSVIATGTAVSGFPAGTHDETNYGPTSTITRGNPTMVIRWSSAGNSPTVTYTYDEAGNVISRTAPCGNGSCMDMSSSSQTITYSYSNAFTELSGDTNVAYSVASDADAYVTGITDALGKTSSFTYDYSNGQLTSATDVNGQPTSYVYDDLLNRLTGTTYPDGGAVNVSYDDDVPSVTTSEVLSSSGSYGPLTKVDIYDGLGHVVQTQLTSDPDGTDYVDMKYDGSGRIFTQSNPHRSASSPSDGVTTHYYEALGNL